VYAMWKIKEGTYLQYNKKRFSVIGNSL